MISNQFQFTLERHWTLSIYTRIVCESNKEIIFFFCSARESRCRCRRDINLRAGSYRFWKDFSEFCRTQQQKKVATAPSECITNHFFQLSTIVVLLHQDKNAHCTHSIVRTTFLLFHVSFALVSSLLCFFLQNRWLLFVNWFMFYLRWSELKCVEPDNFQS